MVRHDIATISREASTNDLEEGNLGSETAGSRNRNSSDTAVEPDIEDASWLRFWGRNILLILEPWGLSVFLICIPFAWAAHWKVDSWGHEAQFFLCFLSIMSLQNVFESCGDQLALRAGKDISELICISFRNCVEATLAFILLIRCHLRLLQSTIIGVVVLHLLLVQGAAFFVDASLIGPQELSKHHVSIKPSLLMVGVLGVVIPTAFFAALDHGDNTIVAASPPIPLVGDGVRGWLLDMSHAVSVVLLVVYVISRVHRRYFHNVPDNGLACAQKEPRTTDLVPRRLCAFFIVVSIVVMSVTTEFLVESIDPLRERYDIQAEFFGLVVLPLVSFLPEGTVALYKFLPNLSKVTSFKLLSQHSRSAWLRLPECQRTVLFSFVRKLQMRMPPQPQPEARGAPIDSSIQFLLWWMPLVILVGWWIGKPMYLLFDYFEVALLLGTCFLVNHVTADGKTNFAEGFTMYTFYAMVALAAWFYPGQTQVGYMLSCPSSVAAAVASGVQNALVLH
ncbi:hypothetical protein C8Q73DRAFT_458163 [Cubamyces lactineus]|nr:hypothetical protein C8Q73DRAFT_458163 [Cubamyces lactineus]